MWPASAIMANMTCFSLPRADPALAKIKMAPWRRPLHDLEKRKTSLSGQADLLT